MMITCSFKKIKLDETPYILDEGAYKIGILYHSLLPFTNKKDEIDLEFVRHYLGEWEQEYYNSYFRNKKRQYHLLFGRIVSKKLIKRYFLRPIQGVTLGYSDIEIKNCQAGDQKGQPEITFNGVKQNLNVTIAHCDEFAGAIVSEGCRVGIDIEVVKVFDDCFKGMISNINERNSIKENNYQLSNIKKWTLFWTVKEAIGKAMGVGLYHGFNSIQIYYTDVEDCIQIKFNEKMNSLIKEKFKLVEIQIYYQFIKKSCCTYCIMKEK